MLRLAPALAVVLASVPLLVVAEAAEARPHDHGAIVYVSDIDSPAADRPNDDVFLITPADQHVYRMTNDDGTAERNPTLSPDGRWLAFVRYVDDPFSGDLIRCRVRLSARGQACTDEERVIGPVSTQPIAWAPDSRSLLYSGLPTADADTDLYLVRARGGTPSNLTNEPVDGVAGINTQPSVAPDGRWVYYGRGTPVTGTGADLYRSRIDGSGAEQLTRALDNDQGVDVSPDGRRLVFHSNRDGADDFDIYTMRADVESLTNPAVNLTDPLRSPVGAVVQERRPSWSPDGRSIAFHWYTAPTSGLCTGCSDGEVYTMRADGTRVRNLTANNPVGDRPPATPLYADINPDWGALRHHR